MLRRNRIALDTTRMLRIGALTAYAMPFAFSAHFSHQGRRPRNDDSVLQVATLDGALLCLLADGFGPYGQQASRFSVQHIAALYGSYLHRNPRTLLPWAVEHIHRQLAAWRRSLPYGSDTGCTLEAAVITPGRIVLAHAGDSRAYLLRGQQLWSLTQDHTIAGAQPHHGRHRPLQHIPAEMRHVLLHYLGSNQQHATDYYDFAAYPGDYLLLCSDGVWGHLNESDLHNHLYRSNPTRAALNLVRRALERGSSDNVSAVVVQLVDSRSYG
ncbi:MAG: serine/threonine-protein phosphatase [Candidatus Viridilinea halotolerans]|uniref:Serine/threonine-protein phosphatase n=1 Tax=Candidatus Viridilinea halotolerans TaxID=2491704 RepID=A0A426TSB3_9CHLR|nr:MAG: serine/threonine-protein phosphatase [Candidatus Viridilinea halotolerans]